MLHNMMVSIIFIEVNNTLLLILIHALEYFTDVRDLMLCSCQRFYDNDKKVRYKDPSLYIKLILTNLAIIILPSGVCETRYNVVQTLFKRSVIPF